MAEEPVPVVGLRHRVPGPVRLLAVGEDDPRASVALVGLAPHVVAPVGRGGRAARLLEPWMPVGGVVDDEVGDHPKPAPMRGVEEALEVGHAAVVGVDPVEVGDVVAIVPQRRRVHGKDPQAVDAQVAEVIELLGEARQVADPVGVRVKERLDGQLVEDGVLVPERACRRHASASIRFCPPDGHGATAGDRITASAPADTPFLARRPGSRPRSRPRPRARRRSPSRE